MIDKDKQQWEEHWPEMGSTHEQPFIHIWKRNSTPIKDGLTFSMAHLVLSRNSGDGKCLLDAGGKIQLY